MAIDDLHVVGISVCQRLSSGVAAAQYGHWKSLHSMMVTGAPSGPRFLSSGCGFSTFCHIRCRDGCSGSRSGLPAQSAAASVSPAELSGGAAVGCGCGRGAGRGRAGRCAGRQQQAQQQLRTRPSNVSYFSFSWILARHFTTDELRESAEGIWRDTIVCGRCQPISWRRPTETAAPLGGRPLAVRSGACGRRGE